MAQNESVEIIEAALSQSFSLPSSRRQSVIETPAPPSSQTTESIPIESADVAATEAGLDDSWKQEYEAQVQSWRNESAQAREKAENERARWEAIRGAEREEAARRKAAGIVDEPQASGSQRGEGSWENVGGKLETPSTLASSIQDSLETTDRNGRGSTEPRSQLQQDTTDESQKWEDVQASVTSSFPSMSFPERTETPSPSRQPPATQPAPPSATLAIFDSSLSTRTRFVALLSSLAINMALPFVNGVMLGFGEIFAKNFIMEWLGWRPAGTGTIATTAGLRSTREQRQKQFK